MQSPALKKSDMTTMQRFVLLAAVLLLSACAANRVRVGQPGIVLSPASLGETVSVLQRILVEHGERADTIDIVLEIDSERLNLVGLVLGNRALSVYYDGSTLTSWRHVLLPNHVRAEDVLENLQLALWPLDVIKKTLPPDWQIKECSASRTLYLKGEKIIDIRYSGHPRWIGTIMFTNARYGYTLSIQSALIE